MYPNERDITGVRTHISNIASVFKELALPIQDVFRTTKKENTLHNSKLFLLPTFIVFSSELFDAWESLLDFSKKLAPISLKEAVAEYSATVNFFSQTLV